MAEREDTDWNGNYRVKTTDTNNLRRSLLARFTDFSPLPTGFNQKGFNHYYEGDSFFPEKTHFTIEEEGVLVDNGEYFPYSLSISTIGDERRIDFGVGDTQGKMSFQPPIEQRWTLFGGWKNLDESDKRNSSGPISRLLWTIACPFVPSSKLD